MIFCFIIGNAQLCCAQSLSDKMKGSVWNRLKSEENLKPGDRVYFVKSSGKNGTHKFKKDGSLKFIARHRHKNRKMWYSYDGFVWSANEKNELTLFISGLALDYTSTYKLESIKGDSVLFVFKGRQSAQHSLEDRLVKGWWDPSTKLNPDLSSPGDTVPMYSGQTPFYYSFRFKKDGTLKINKHASHWRSSIGPKFDSTWEVIADSYLKLTCQNGIWRFRVVDMNGYNLKFELIGFAKRE